MNRVRLFILFLPLMLAACQTVSDRNTIAELRGRQVDIREETLDDGLDKAMASYERFLQDTPDSALTPEAIRRLADLKIEKEYGTITEAAGDEIRTAAAAAELTAPEPLVQAAPDETAGSNEISDRSPVQEESESDFEKRTTQNCCWC